nr:transglycosylase SLT domain-containing protein [Spirochaetota bacterium]
NKACSPDNLFKKEATETLIKILAENKEFEELKKLLRNNFSLIDDKEESDFFLTFLNGENLSKIKSIPHKKEFAFILYEIIKNDKKVAKKIENIEKIITFFSKLNPKDSFFVKNDFLIDEILQATDDNPFINLTRDYFTKKRTTSEKDIVLALEGVRDNSRAEFLKKICSNIFGGKIFFLSLEQTRDKSQKWFSYQYALEAFNYKPKNFALSVAQNALKNFQNKDNFNYNLRAKILYAEYNFNKKWASDVVDFVNDYPKSYHSKSLLNLALRSAIYQNKKDIIIPLLSKIDLESMDSINQSENYYIFYLIDNDEKWKNILLEKFPLSYGALVLNGSNVKIREGEYKKKSENYTETGKTIFRKINRLLEFDLSADAKNISTSRLNDDEKIEANDIFYNYYIYKEDYYNAVKIAGIYAELIYGENIKNIDKETLKRLFPFHYENFVFEYSKEFDIEPSLIYAVMREESRYKKDIVSFANAIGLMQVIPKTGDFISSKIKMSSYDLTNPADNIR